MPASPFLVHNVDVLSTIDLERMVEVHRERNALATLAVQERATSRQLLFDERGRLCGRRAGRDARLRLSGLRNRLKALAFCGIHVLSPRIFAQIEEEGAFSIVSTPICA